MNSEFSNKLKAEARSLGFFACGIAQARPVNDGYARRFLRRVSSRTFADMEYMYRHVDLRLDPRLLVPGVQSIVSLALPYAPAVEVPRDELHLAAYALGKDYHDVMRQRMQLLVARLGITGGYRCFVDTAPVLEQYWAQQSGIGWIGRNQQLIIPHAGSQFFLGEIFLDIPLDYDEPMASRCGTCDRCLQACPTHAIHLDDGGESTMDACRCLSYQTIENRGPLSDEVSRALGNCFYGCDRCQQACPWNRFAQPTDVPEFQPSQELMAMTTADWQQLTEDDYRRLFKGSAVKRAKYAGITRNIAAATADD